MKRRTALFTFAASLLVSAVSPLQAAPVLLNRITNITPAQASVGQQIVVTVSNPALDPALAQLLKINRNKFIDFSGRLPNFSSLITPYKVMFQGAGTTFIEGQQFTSLGDNRYSVVVPQGARTGRLKLVRGSGSEAPSSLSTGTFTVVTLGIAVDNRSQYNVVSIQVNGVEKLGANQVVAPGQVADIGLPAGSNYRVIYFIGHNRQRPILGRDAGVVTARAAINTQGHFPVSATVARLTAREMLRSTPSFTVNGNFMTSRWMGLNVLTGFFEGYDFISDITNGNMTFRRWQGDPQTVVATGTVNEPGSWTNLVNEIAVPMRNTNGSTHANAVITLSNPNGFLPSFIVGDGLVFEPQ